MLAAHDAVATTSRKAQHKLGYVGQPGPTCCAYSFARPSAGDSTPTGTGRPAEGEGDLSVGDGSLQEPRPTESLRVMPAAEFVGVGRRFMGIEEHVAVRCPCCDATDVDTRHARICPRAGAQVNQHQPLLDAISRSLKRHGAPHQAESGEPFTADRNLRMDIIVRGGGFWNAPNPEYRDKSILVDVIHADP